MIYLTEGNIPLNAAYDDDIVQEANSTYQLTFKFPTNDILWQRLREEKFLTADDLHSEQDFVIFEVEKKHGYIQVYANQVMTMLNHYVVNPMSLDRQTGSTALSQFAGSITRENPFSFFSDIEDRHTFNTDTTNAMEALTKDKHSILGQWGGDLVRHGYQVRLLKNGGSENESLFMYKKNLSSYQHKTSTKSLRTRITFITTVRGEGENADDKHYKVVVDSPLINKYSQIYEDVVEVNDQDVKDEASLREYGKQYFRTTLCDMLEDSIEIDVAGHSDVPIQIFDIVGVYHEFYNLDVRKKITKYTYSPMAKKLKSIGFGQFQSGLANAIGNVVSDAFKSENQHFQSNFERQLARELKNADLAFERKKEELTNQFTDEVNVIKAKNEENKQKLSDEINRKFHDFSPSGFEEVKASSEEALKKARASEDLAKEAKIIANDNLNKLNDNEAIFAEYKQSVAGRIANLASQMTGKANQVEFQRVKETAQLYERILGNTDNGIADNVARMALTNQLFQVEVAKNIGSDLNYLRNSNFASEGKFWNVVGATNLGINYEHSLKNHGKSGVHFYGENVQREYYGFAQEIRFLGKVGEKVAISFELAREGSLEFSDIRFGLHFKKNNNILHQKWRTISLSEIKLKSYTRFEYVYEIPIEVDSLNIMFYGLNGKTTNIYLTDVKIEKNSKCTVWTANPQDITETIEATRTQVTQLAGSWSVQNLTSAGDIINGINVAANGNNRIIGRATHISGETLIDNAVIKSAMIDKLKTANFEAGSVTTNILGAEAVTAEKVKFDTAFIQRLVSQQAFIDELFAKQATITRVQSIDITAEHVKGGKLTSLNGVTDFDLQTGWIDMNGFGVGIKNQFPNRPLQYLVFGAGNINGVDASYTALLSNRNGLQQMDHTSAGLQIWNGRTGDNVQSAINMYGRRITFNQSAQGGLREVAIDTDAHSITGLDEIYIKNVRLSLILNDIYDNFRNLAAVPGNYSRGYHSQWR
nr:MAG TPA: Neck appendage protein [Caudoviricetes sp.]